MSHYKLISFEKTPSIENQLGIATVLLDDKWIIRFKLVNLKDRSGYFIATPNLKGEPEGEKTTWLDAFIPERNSEKEELYNFIRSEVSKSNSRPLPSPQRAKQDMDDTLPF